MTLGISAAVFQSLGWLPHSVPKGPHVSAARSAGAGTKHSRRTCYGGISVCCEFVVWIKLRCHMFNGNDKHMQFATKHMFTTKPDSCHDLNVMQVRDAKLKWMFCPTPSRSMSSVLVHSSPFTKMALVNCHFLVLGPFGTWPTQRGAPKEKKRRSSMSPPTSKSMPACGQLRLKANHLPSLYLLRLFFSSWRELETGFVKIYRTWWNDHQFFGILKIVPWTVSGIIMGKGHGWAKSYVPNSSVDHAYRLFWCKNKCT